MKIPALNQVGFIAVIIIWGLATGCKPSTGPSTETPSTPTATATPTPVPNTPCTAPTPVNLTGIKSVLVSWTANREKLVNRASGGYRVYYSTTSNFCLSGATFADVPYVAGATAPTSKLLTNLPSGTYYIKVVAYSASLTAGSSASQQFTVTVP